MGLFKRKEKEPAPEERVIRPTDLVGVGIDANLTENAVKVSVPDDEEGLLIKNVYLWQEDDTIKGLQGDKVVFEVSKRSKAYKDLEPVARKKTSYITLKKKKGDYGIYYRLRAKVEMTREEAGLK